MASSPCRRDTAPERDARALASQRRRSPAIGWLLAALAAGCAGATPHAAIVPGYEGAPGTSRFVVAPSNLAAALPPELESGVAPVESQIATYLAQQGKTVERLPLRDATRLWRASVTELSESGAAPRFGAVAQRFAQSLRRTHDFDALVMPVLLLDHVPVRHRTASWDGVTRRVRVVNAPRRSAGRNDSLMADGLVDGGNLHATMPVSSLYVMVLTPAGERVFHGRGGIDFVDELDLANVAETYTFEIRRREDLFEDPAVLRESVAAAFTPYLPPVREP